MYLNFWRLLCKNQPMNSNSDILQSCLWFNTQISLEPLYYLNWTKKEILFVGDLVKPNGEVIKPAETENFYRLKVNGFYHYRIKSLINVSMKKHKKEYSLEFIQPNYPVQLKTLIVPNKDVKNFIKVSIIKKLIFLFIRVSGGVSFQQMMTFGKLYLERVLNQ